METLGGQIDTIVAQHDVISAKIAAKQKVIATAKGNPEEEDGAAIIVRGTLTL